ncbi:hypothetical protein [Streptomyces sp. NPDC002176]|uniref:hypothetical protein n=1 Tax=Streptomyces sp. NPDC002176 TaxID=3364634 RepID=UPI0038508A81
MDRLTDRWGTELYRWGKQVWGRTAGGGRAMKDGKPWVGDEVRDGATGRRAIVTDVRRNQAYILRPRAGGGPNWVAEDPEGLTVITPRRDGPAFSPG